VALLPVVKYGHPILRQKVRLVTDFSNLDKLVKDMLETMVHEEGIGLAANQVGQNINLMLVDVSRLEDETDTKPRIFVNVNVVETHGRIVMKEGCLSIPDIRAEIYRPEFITVAYQDLKGKSHTKQFSGLISRVFQHEFDHLEGKFFTDYLPVAKKLIIQKRLKEISDTGFPSVSVTL